MTQVPVSLDSDIVVKIASTPEEREGAFRVLHDVYVEMGFCSPQPDGMRTIPHHSLPETPIIIAKHGDEVVGTMTLADNDVFDLPLEKSWELSRFRSGNRKVLEVTCFAIDKAYRRAKQKNVFFPLIQFMYQYVASILSADFLVIATHPKVRDFYEGVLYFEPIDMRVIEDYIRAPAIAMFLDVKLFPSRYFAAYGQKPAAQNLYRYFVSECAIEPYLTAASTDTHPLLLDFPEQTVNKISLFQTQ
jgi:hypothetical protein